MDLLTKMATYVRIIESGRILAAEKQLRIAPSSVSKQLAGLEDDVGQDKHLHYSRGVTVEEMWQAPMALIRLVATERAAGSKGIQAFHGVTEKYGPK